MRGKRIGLLVLAAATWACGTTERRVAPSERVNTFASERALRERALATPAPAAPAAVLETRDGGEAAPADAGFARFPRFDAASNMVIRSGQASVEVDSLERAVTAVRLLAQRVGGYVANTTMQTGRNQLRTASLEVKIPAEQFDAGLAALWPIGRLESVNVTAEDVGEEFVDVRARMDNARRVEARLIDLIATRTGKLADVLEVEQTLARVREEIERYNGRLRYLQAHAALSTLTVSIHEPLPVVGDVGSSVLGEAFKQAWRNFVGLLAWLVRSLGILVPVGAIALAAWTAVRRRRPGTTASAAA
ncbi:MAG TPA: DUF4349 domain-containing protein [Gemmatimonadales bacterium]|nr:DUF4349 domain-containing protein [Gemmatimonadales bacterium]